MSGLSEEVICKDGMGGCRVWQVSRHGQETWQVAAGHAEAPCATRRAGMCLIVTEGSKTEPKCFCRLVRELLLSGACSFASG